MSDLLATKLLDRKGILQPNSKAGRYLCMATFTGAHMPKDTTIILIIHKIHKKMECLDNIKLVNLLLSASG